MPEEFFGTTTLHKKVAVIAYIEIKEADLIAIDKMNSNLVTSPNGFPAILLKKCKGDLVRPIQILLQRFLNIEKLLKKGKVGIICPVYKESGRVDVKNYRAFSLTSHVNKVMEHIVRRHISYAP